MAADHMDGTSLRNFHQNCKIWSSTIYGQMVAVRLTVDCCGSGKAHIHSHGKLWTRKYSLEAIHKESVLCFPKRRPHHYKRESNSQLSCQSSAMSPRRVLEVRPGDQDPQKWRMPLTEDAFDSFIARGGDAAGKVFGEGSLFSPLLFGKFFDPGDAFPLWDFDSEILLSGLRSASKTSVDWDETDSEYVLRAELPVGARNCDVEICGEKGKVIEISGKWRGRESDSRDWRTGRWWEHGYVRRLELPESANWRKMEACIDNDNFIEIKIPKNISDSSIED